MFSNRRKRLIVRVTFGFAGHKSCVVDIRNQGVLDEVLRHFLRIRLLSLYAEGESLQAPQCLYVTKIDEHHQVSLSVFSIDD